MNDTSLDVLDILNVLSFVIGLLNYNENLTQGDKQDLMQALNVQTSTLLEEIHNHLTEQDDKLNILLEAQNAKNSEIS